MTLSECYYRSLYKCEHYNNPETGGVYEHRLATWMGVPNEPMIYQGKRIDVPSSLFLAAVEILAEDGYVKRLERLPGYPVKGIQITNKGLARAEYLKSRWFYKSKCFKTRLLRGIHDFDNKHRDIIWAVVFAFIFAFIVAAIIEILKMKS
jgi:hypothetical protein